MLFRSKEENERTKSLTSSSLLSVDLSYGNIDLNRLYESVLKLTILEYSNEARFWQRTRERSEETGKLSGSSGTSSNSGKRRSMKLSLDGGEARFPSYLLPQLESNLNLIAMKKKGSKYDDMTRRSLLRFYSELLDPRFKAELASSNTPEYWVMKFVSSANKEVVKVGTTANDKISSTVMSQAETFVEILISLIQKDKNSEVIISKLRTCMDSLKPSNKEASPTRSQRGSRISVQYIQPSYRYTDIDQGIISTIMNIFSVDLVKLQQDIFRFKDICSAKPLHKDLNQIIFYLEKDLGQFAPEHFGDVSAYLNWKERELSTCKNLKTKYEIPPNLKLLSTPPLSSGEDFYILPPSHLTKPFYVVLSKLCMEKKNGSDEQTLFSKQSQNLMNLCAKYWRIDYPTRACSLFTAAHISGLMIDPLFGITDKNSLGPIAVEKAVVVLHSCKRIIEDQGRLDWDEKEKWSFKDQESWIKNLTYSYNEVFLALKELLHEIFSKHSKPKFGPYLQFLGDYIETDALFTSVQNSGLPKKWEKKLSKVLLRTAELRYADLLSVLPRDDTLSILHILDICDNIVADIKMLQKRYKYPLLGFLNIPRTVAAVITGMFSADAKNILKHIDAYAKSKKTFIAYADAIEAYKALSEIRDIYQQVSISSSEFRFDLEGFFYPYLKEWIAETGLKISGIVEEAIAKDSFEPIDIERDDKKHSSSVFDIFTVVKEYLRILNNLGWQNEFQLATTYTKLLKSISEGVLCYATRMSDIIVEDLDEEEERKRESASRTEKLERRKSGNWFDEVKNVVTNFQQGSKAELEKPYNFKPRLCIALNNISAMMQNVSKLEELLDPFQISSCIAGQDPSLQKNYTSHIFSIRLVRAENLKSTNSSSIHPYVTMIDTKARKTIAKTRTVNNTNFPDFDEEFELTIPAHTSLTISATVWDEKFGTHSICGRALLVLDPKRFKHDGIPEEIYLDLDSQGRVLIEIAVESERMDAVFFMGRTHRYLARTQERCVKLIVEKFSYFIHYCFSRSSLRAICGSSGNIKPTEEQMDSVMMPLYNYLNMNLEVLAGYLTNDLLMKVMLEAWSVIVSTADELLLPKLSSAKTFQLSSLSNKSKQGSRSNLGGWQTAVSSAVANVTSSIGMGYFGKQLTNNELETVFSWLNFLCFDFFHNGGNGPPIKDLKNQQYQTLLLVPVYYDREVSFLKEEVERLSPAFVMALRGRNNFDGIGPSNSTQGRPGSSMKDQRSASIVRHKTILANATVKSREKAEKDAQKAKSDPIATQTLTEDIILRLLIIKGETSFVARRLEQREKLARSIATERLARAAVEGKFQKFT